MQIRMIAYLLFSSLLVIGTNAHDWGFGNCPSVAPLPGLSLDKFVGLWYVIEQFDTTSTCLTFNYTRTSETTIQITKHRQFYLLDRAGLDHTNSYTGSLDIPYVSNPGLLRVKWPLNAAGKADYIIFDTDYDTYAGVYDCQPITFFMYRESAAILSRTPNLDPIYVERIKRRLETFAVETEDFSVIDHNSCRAKDDSDFNINVDENTFRDVFSDTADTIKDVANKVAGSIQTVAATVVDGVQNIGTSGNIKEAAEVAVPADGLNDVELLH